MKSFLLVTLQLLALICLFGVWIAPITRSIDPSVSDWVVLFGRFCYAALVVIVGAKVMGRINSRSYPERIRNLLRRKDGMNVLVAGFYLASSYFAYTVSFRLSSHLAPALSLGNIPIVWILLVYFRRSVKETPLTFSLAVGILFATGSFLIPGEGGTINAATGWGLVASIFLAAFLIKAEKLPRQAPSYAIVAWYCLVGTAMGFLGLLGSFSPEFIRILVRPEFHLKMIGLGAGTVAAFFLYTWVLGRVSPLIVSSFLVLTPAANSIMDKLFLGHSKITPMQNTGVWLVSVMLVILYFTKAYEDKANRESS